MQANDEGAVITSTRTWAEAVAPIQRLETITDYSEIVPDRLVLERDPLDGNLAQRSIDVALLRISEDNRVSIITRTLSGNDDEPIDEWQGRTLVYRIAEGPCAIDVDALRADLQEGGKLAKLVDAVVASHTTNWIGSNYVGKVNVHADTKLDDWLRPLGGRCRYVSARPWISARDWLLTMLSNSSVEQALADCGLDANSSPEEIAKAAAAIADDDRVIVIGDIADALTTMVNQATRQD